MKTNKDKKKKSYEKLKRAIAMSVVAVVGIATILGVAISTNENTTPTPNIKVEANQDDITDIPQEPSIPSSSPQVLTFTVPLANFEVSKDFSNKTLKYNATLKQWESHKAIDLKANAGEAVRASLGGQVTAVQNDYLKGNMVTIVHEGGFKTVYASMSEDTLVQVGDTVKQGDLIGYVATSARNELADGAHLHFEMYKDSVAVDPNLYITFEDK